MSERVWKYVIVWDLGCKGESIRGTVWEWVSECERVSVWERLCKGVCVWEGMIESVWGFNFLKKFFILKYIYFKICYI